MLANRFHRREQIARGIRLDNVSPGPSVQGFPHHLRRIMLRNEKNLKLRRLSPQQTACLQTIHSRHGHVQNHYIGIQVFRFFHSLCAVGCFPNDFPSRAPLQESLQPLPYDWVIIDQQYANCHAVLFL